MKSLHLLLSLAKPLESFCTFPLAYSKNTFTIASIDKLFFPHIVMWTQKGALTPSYLAPGSGAQYLYPCYPEGVDCSEVHRFFFFMQMGMLMALLFNIEHDLTLLMD